MLAAWRAAGARGSAQRKAWEQRAGKLDAGKRARARRSHGCGGARGAGRGGRRHQGGVRRRAAQDRHPRRLAEGAGEARPGAALPDRRLGRSHRLQRHAHHAPHDRRARRFPRQLHPLRRARACHGRGHERAGAARRHRALRRHVPGLHRLLPSRDPPLRHHGPARDLRDDARLDRARRGRAHAPADRASGGPARHAQPQRVPAGRPDRDGGVLGAGAQGRAGRRRSWH